MDRYIFEITVKDSKPSIWRRLAVPATHCFEHLHYIIQASFNLENINNFQFFNGNTKDHFESFHFFDDDDADELEADGCHDSVITPISQYFATRKNLRYGYGEWLFEIKLKGLDKSGSLFASLQEGEGKIVYEQCGGIYAQMIAQEALTKHAGEPIAKLASKMMHKKNADFSLSRTEFNTCQRLVDDLEMAFMRLASVMADEFKDDIPSDMLSSFKNFLPDEDNLLN